MPQNITLQANNSAIVAGDILGRIGFAASNESDGLESRWIAASIYAEASGAFLVSENPTNLVLATSNADGITPRLRVSNLGHFLPYTNNTYDLGSSVFKYRGIYASSGVLDRVNTTGIQLTGSVSRSGLLFVNNSDLVAASPNVLFSSGDLASPKLIFRASGSLTPDVSLNILTSATNVASGVQTLSVQGSAGELFSITDVLDSGTIFSVNDISGLGLIEADADGTVTLARYGTNVAVGNVVPTQKLHVAGNLRVSGAFFDSLNSPGTSGQVLVSTSGGTDWKTLSEITGVDGTGSAGYVARWSDTDTIGSGVIYDNGTNVGVGTTSPDAPITIGNGTTTGTSGVKIWTTGGSHAFYVSSNAAYLQSYNRTYIRNNTVDVFDSNGGLSAIANAVPGFPRGFYATPLGAAYKGVVIRGQAAQSETLTEWQDSAGIVLARVDAAGSISGVGSGVFMQRVGIGVSNPSEKLHVVGNGYFVGYIGVNQTPSSFYDIYTSGPIRSNTAYIAASNAGYYSLGASSDVILTRDAAGTLAQRNGVNAQVFRVYNTYTDASNYERAKLEWSGNTLNIGTEQLGTGAARSLAIQTSGTNRILIDASGNVGIGTESPTQRLHISGNMRLTGALFDSLNLPGTSGQVLVSTSGGVEWRTSSGGIDGTGSADYLARWIDADTLGTGIVYDDGTNVGVRTTAPSTTLDVRGTGYFSESIRTSGTVVFASGNTGTVGVMQWNNGEGTVQLGLKGGNVNVELAQDNVVLCYNGVGSSLSKGQVVYVSGAQGQRPAINLALANSEDTAARTIGFVDETIGIGAEGFVSTFGVITNLDTSALIEGSGLWLSATTPGAITMTRPVAPNHGVFLGWCLKSNASSGRILIHVQNGAELEELHDVLIQNVASGQLIQYDSSNGTWRNRTAAQAGLVEGVGTSGYVARWTGTNTIATGVVYDNGTNVGIGTTSPTQKLDINGSLITNASVYVSGNNRIAQIYNDGNLKIDAVGGYTRILTNFMVDGNVYLNDGDTYGLNASTNSLRFFAYDSSTHGNIQFFSNNSVERMRIDSNGNLGVGTTSPTQKLDVRGSAFISGALYDSTNSAGTNGQVLTSTATGTDWKSLSEITGVDGVGTSGYVARWTDTDTIGTGVIYDNGTNVGIGTASPSTKLHVRSGTGDVSESGGLTIEGTGTGARTWQLTPTTADTLLLAIPGLRVAAFNSAGKFFAGGLSNTSGAGARFTASTSGVTIGQNYTTAVPTPEGLLVEGRVGIGTTSPSYPLHISTTSDTPAFVTSSNTRTIFQIDNTAADGDPMLAFVLSGSSAWNIGVDDSDSDKLKIGTSALVGGANAKLTLDSAGNVGIGTESPVERLHVSGNALISGALFDNARSGFTHFYSAGNAHILGKELITEAGILFSPSSPSVASNQYRFGVSSEFLRVSRTVAGATVTNNIFVISSGDRIGMNIASPEAHLHMNILTSATTGVIVRGAAAQSADLQQWQDSAGTKTAYVDAGGNIYSSGIFRSTNVGNNSGFRMNYAALTETVSALSTIVGNNIIAGSTNSTVRRHANSADSGNFMQLMYDRGITFHTGLTSTLNTDVAITTNERMRIALNGNVGIGTTSPAELFTVYGSNQNIQLQSATNAGSNAIIFADTAARFEIYRPASSSDLRFKSRNGGVGDVMTIGYTNGYVGIGTTNPQYLLDVSGTIRANHVTAITKSFLIDHPTKPGKSLRYASLEGPENGVYLRGSSSGNYIILPDYWCELVNSESITVNLTPVGTYQQLWVKSKNVHYIEVGGVDGAYDYAVWAERKDVPRLEVEI